MKINYKSFSVEVFGENIWVQTYLNRVGFDSEEEADKFIESLEEEERIYSAIKIVNTSYNFKKTLDKQTKTCYNKHRN